MVRLESVCVWIGIPDGTTCPVYLFDDSISPRPGFTQVVMRPNADGTRIASLTGIYVYGDTSGDVFAVSIDPSDLVAAESSLVGSGNLIDRILGLVQQLRVDEIAYQYNLPASSDPIQAVVNLFVLQFSVTVIISAMMGSPEFWSRHLLPLAARLPEIPGRINRSILEMMTSYIMTAYATTLPIPLRPCLDMVVAFADVWGSGIIAGCSTGTGLFITQVNLSFLAYLRSTQGDGLGDRLNAHADGLTRSLSAHFSAFSDRVQDHCIARIIERVDSHIKTSIEQTLEQTFEKTFDVASIRHRVDDYLCLIRGQVDQELARLRQAAVSLADVIPLYEERLLHLESRLEHQNALERKVEHLQSTVTQLLRLSRC